ncbi:MAG: hypothetical protein HY558_05335 [Euryarchaeota archaeon]|nr:hypothetical protein [Euryarchaeota archaeon]
MQVDLGAAPAGRYALLLRADGLTLEERVVVLSGEPRTVVLYAPTGAREVWVNSILAVEGAPGPAVETPEAPPWHPPLWLYPLAGVPLLLALGPRLRRLREKWWMETRHPAEYAAHRSLRRFEHTWSERYVQMARLARNLERLETPRPAAAG